MKSIQKSLRHHYWFITSFTRKNFRFILVSFIAAFFGIVFILNFFPLFNSLLFSSRKVVGLIGQYSLQNPPVEISSIISIPLITTDQNGELQPVLANSWEVLNDGKTYRFHLKTDLFWYDGKRFKASDIQYSFQDVTIKVIDDFTIDFNLKQPLTIFPIYLSKPVVKAPLVGIGGVYRVQSYSAKKNIIQAVNLTPNKSGDPYLIYRFYKTEDELVTAYKKGEITSFSTPNRNIAELFASWKNTKIDRVVDYNQIVSIFFNTKSGPLQERDMRKAIALTVPPLTDYGVLAKGPIPPTSWAFNDGIKEIQLNPERAKTLIEKNKTASDSANLTLFTFYDYITQAEQIKSDLGKVGLPINLKIVSAVPESFDMLLTAWNPPKDPDQYFFWHSTQEATNITRLDNKKIDKLLEDGRRIVNSKQREKIYEDFQKTITDEQPAVFLYYPYTYTISRK